MFKIIITLALFAAFNVSAQEVSTNKQITAACKLEANAQHPECIKRAAKREANKAKREQRNRDILATMATN